MWYKECLECDFYYKDDEVEYCRLALRGMNELNCIGETPIKESVDE